MRLGAAKRGYQSARGRREEKRNEGEGANGDQWEAQMRQKRRCNNGTVRGEC